MSKDAKKLGIACLISAGLITSYLAIKYFTISALPIVIKGETLCFPFSLSRLWDILIGPVWSIALFPSLSKKKKKIEGLSGLVSGLGLGIIFAMVYRIDFGVYLGLIFGIGFGFVFGFLLGRDKGLSQSIMFSLAFSLVFALFFGIVLGLGFAAITLISAIIGSGMGAGFKAMKSEAHFVSLRRLP